VIQSGPTTGEFAVLRRLFLEACRQMGAALAKELGVTHEQANADILVTGLRAMEAIRKQVYDTHGDTAASAVLFDACLTGFGWSGIATFYGLELDYVRTLDTLNDITVIGDSDLPPTNKKGE
jgi:hypothetical protein